MQPRTNVLWLLLHSIFGRDSTARLAALNLPADVSLLAIALVATNLLSGIVANCRRRSGLGGRHTLGAEKLRDVGQRRQKLACGGIWRKRPQQPRLLGQNANCGLLACNAVFGLYLRLQPFQRPCCNGNWEALRFRLARQKERLAKEQLRGHATE